MPMLCNNEIYELTQQNLQKFENHIKEYKYDGCRALFEITRNDIRIFNRYAQDITFKFPEFVDIAKKLIVNWDNFKRILIDGEIISQKDDFREVLARTSLFNPSEIRIRAYSYPLVFMVFDILEVGDETLYDLPLLARKKILWDTLNDTERVRKVPYFEQVEDLSQFKEGIVAKHKFGQYYPFVRDKNWIKLKRFEYSVAEIKGYHLGKKEQNIILETDNGEVSVSSMDKIAEFYRKNPKLAVIRHLPVNTSHFRQPIFINFTDDKNIFKERYENMKI